MTSVTGQNHGRAVSPAPLLNFQVHEPVASPGRSQDRYGCVHTEILMDHVFSNSYGQPFVGRNTERSQWSYTPPPCNFNRVTINFTVTCQGRQFDRLGSMYLGDVEVFRTSTAEPTVNGIIWTYQKQMEQYNVLWRNPQKIIFDLPNIVNSVYTAPLHTTLTAKFFTVPDSPPTADQILPLSARRSKQNAGSAFMVPEQAAVVSLKLPRNVERAVVSLSACGQQAEEFWYTNTFTSDESTFEDTSGPLNGYSPFREVQLWIDGHLAGVSWPFPIIFTGGIVPGFWRPIAGIDAFDLRQHEIDVSPWLPLLCDGKSHTFQIRVAGLNEANDALSDTVGSYWVVTGNVFLFLSPDPKSITTGSHPIIQAPSPTIDISSEVVTNASGTNEGLVYNTTVHRSLTISSKIKRSSKDSGQYVAWTQRLTYSNYNQLSSFAATQSTLQSTVGVDKATLGNLNYTNIYSYPLNVTSTFDLSSNGDLMLNGSLVRGLTYNIFGPSIFPVSTVTFGSRGKSSHSNIQSEKRVSATGDDSFRAALLSTSQSAEAAFFRPSTRSKKLKPYSFGKTSQEFNYQAADISPVPFMALISSSDTVSDSFSPQLLDASNLATLRSLQGQGNGDAKGGRRSGGFEFYHRSVEAVNSTITEDEETIIGGSSADLIAVPKTLDRVVIPSFAEEADIAVGSIRGLLGRGPGNYSVDWGRDEQLPDVQHRRDEMTDVY